MGEYISLLASVRAGEVLDIPRSVCLRYDACAPAPDAGEVRVRLDIEASVGAGERLYVTGNTASLGGSNERLGAPAQRIEEGRWRASFEAPLGHVLRFQIRRRNANGSWTLESAGRERRVLRLSAEGSLVLETSAQF